MLAVPAMHGLCCAGIYSFSVVVFLLHKKMLGSLKALFHLLRWSCDFCSWVYLNVVIKLTDLHIFNKAGIWNEANLVMNDLFIVLFVELSSQVLYRELLDPYSLLVGNFHFVVSPLFSLDIGVLTSWNKFGCSCSGSYTVLWGALVLLFSSSWEPEASVLIQSLTQGLSMFLGKEAHN